MLTKAGTSVYHTYTAQLIFHIAWVIYYDTYLSFKCPSDESDTYQTDGWKQMANGDRRVCGGDDYIVRVHTAYEINKLNQKVSLTSC